MTTQCFKTRLIQAGKRAFIALPFDPNEVWGVRQRHHVSGSVHGCAVRGALLAEEARYVLPLGPAWRRDNGLDGEAEIEVVLSPEGPQSDLLAADIAAALDAQPQTRVFFEALATFYRKNYIRWIESAKRSETRAARIHEMVGLLKSQKKQK